MADWRAACAVTIPSNMTATLHKILDALRRKEPLLQPLEASAALRTEVPFQLFTVVLS